MTCQIAAPRGDRSLLPDDRDWIFQIHAPYPPRLVVATGADGKRREPSWQHDGSRFLFVRVAGHPTTITASW